MYESAKDAVYEVEMDLMQKELDKRKTEAGKARVKWPQFKFNSPKQVGSLLFEKLKLPGSIKKKTGNWITSRDAIEEIKHLHPVCENITKYNQLTTYYGTFIKGMLERSVGDRIYPSFNVNGTKQGRISHSDPNMGNIPARDPEWSKIRGIFLPDEEYVINAIDYAQIEVCVAAHYSQDPNLLRIIYEGISQHDITAESMEVSRSTAKTINFAMQYGATEVKIAKILDCSRDEAKVALDKYWQTYAGQKRIIDRTIAMVEAGRPIVNLFGRARHFEPGKRKPWSKDRRRGYSHLTQSTAADITNRAFYLVDLYLRERGWGRGSWTVHDELITMVKKEYAEEAFKASQEIMVKVGEEVGLTVPLKTDGKWSLSKWEK